MKEKDLSIQFEPILNCILSNTIGQLTESDIDTWSDEFLKVINEQAQHQNFNLIINGIGYYPESVDVHKKLNQFLKSNAAIKNRCRAVAIIHHDPQHIQEVQSLRTDALGFFNSFPEACEWLNGLD